MARPHSFDPQAALAAAMHVFWRVGYDLASLSELQTAMGIQRGSLYQEFGSKKELFLRALNLYVTKYVDPGVVLLSRCDMSGSERIARFFASIPPGETRGCLLCNTAAGAAGTDEEVRHTVATQLARLRRAFDGALTDAIPDPQHRQREAARLTQEYIGRRIEARAAE